MSAKLAHPYHTGTRLAGTPQPTSRLGNPKPSLSIILLFNLLPTRIYQNLPKTRVGTTCFFLQSGVLSFIDQLLPCPFSQLDCRPATPCHHDGSQLLPYDDFDYMPESNFDEDDIISVNPPDVNVVDAPVVRLKHGRPSSDIWDMVHKRYQLSSPQVCHMQALQSSHQPP
ncbi:hypothetical protein BASA61_001824 [Batrachochytrium salamandrivorans]|nr:hypothetical protein BASA61_001824 [Batrachochytrium salamandrivorans]